MNEDLTALIIKELSKCRDHKEITRKVCKEGGLNWKEAEQLTVLVAARYKRTFTARPRPLLLFFSIGILLLGIGLLVYNMPIIVAIFQREVLSQVINAQGSSHGLNELIAGAGLTLGGMFGLWKALQSIFPY